MQRRFKKPIFVEIFYAMRQYLFYLIISGFFLSINSISYGQSKAQAFEISKNLDIYATLFKELNRNYVEEINPGELNTAALDAMLKTLDPYTIYIPESKVEDVRFITTGEYGGVGVGVMKREGKVFISSILSRSPALESGLLAGDEILSVDGHELSEISNEDISKLLKGQPGTVINIKINRIGTEPFDVKVIRKKINVEAVPYYGMLDSSIAYINLSSFTKMSSDKVKNAFVELKKNNPKALIFDLRDNGGGLMSEAVDIMNIFVDKGVEIVKTKSRLRDKNYVYHTRFAPLDTNIPIVFLVNRNTASASEILSGAAQDLDRAVVMGERTFGKGLVQNVIPLSFNAQMKVTIAKYYIPSGRCVQAIDYNHKDEDGNPIAVNDSLLEAFKTKNGRVVYDGRGIKPDVELSPYKVSDISKMLIDKYLVFDFATLYRHQHDSILPAESFTINDDIWEAFVDFLKDKDISYETDLEKSFIEFREKVDADSLHIELLDVCKQIEQEIAHRKENDLENNKEEIERILRTDIVSRYYFTKGVIITNLYQDRAIARAVELLNDMESYNEILKTPPKTREE